MLEPTGGRISVGGVDLGSCRIDAWRRQIAWMPQHPTLLRGTVADNIRLGDPGASDRLVRDAAVRAGADEFIRALPLGYATVVGDGERALSPGERRRIGLARAFLRDAPLVILDEPTADLDPDSVAVVADAVRRLQAGRTVLLIAHRPELVEGADRIVRLADGVAVAEARRRGRVNATLPALLRLVGVPRRRLVAAAVLGALTIVFGVGADGHVRLSDLTRRRAPADPVADGRDRRGPGVRHRPADRALPRAARLARRRAALARAVADALLRAHRAARPGRARGYRKGDLLARMVGDVDAQQNLYLRGLLPPVVALLAGAVAVGAAAAFVPAAGLVLAVGLLTGGLAVPVVSGLVGARAGRRQAAARGALSAELVELLGAAPELVAFGAAERGPERVRAADASLVRLARRDALATGIGDGAGMLVTGVTVAGVLAVAVDASAHGRARPRADRDARAARAGGVRGRHAARGDGPRAVRDARGRPAAARAHRAGARRARGRAPGAGPRGRSRSRWRTSARATRGSGDRPWTG